MQEQWFQPGDVARLKAPLKRMDRREGQLRELGAGLELEIIAHVYDFGGTPVYRAKHPVGAQGRDATVFENMDQTFFVQPADRPPPAVPGVLPFDVGGESD